MAKALQKGKTQVVSTGADSRQAGQKAWNLDLEPKIRSSRGLGEGESGRDTKGRTAATIEDQGGNLCKTEDTVSLPRGDKGAKDFRNDSVSIGGKVALLIC